MQVQYLTPNMHLLLIVFALLGSALADGSFEKLITEGAPAKDGLFPYQVGLKIDSDEPSKCGGALISATHILTAARCVDGHSVEDITAYMGSIRFGEGMETKPESMVVHPDYDSELFINNIALLKIDSVELSNTIAAIRIPSKNNFLEARVSIASGWGQTSPSSEDSPILQYAKLFVLSKNACAAHFSKSVEDFSYPVLCTAAPDTAIGCIGDYGGPLMFKDTKTLIGIMSSGPEDCSPETSYTTIFTDVVRLRDWIKENIKK